MKRVSIAFLGNAYKDSRVMNLYRSLLSEGCDVRVISFDWQSNKSYSEQKNIQVIKLRKGSISLLFYISFAYHLLKHYLNNKYDLYISEDVYTLPFASLFSRIRKGKLYYNSRELYPFLAGLRKRSSIQKIIAKIEKRYIKNCHFVMATGKMDADFLMEFYGLNKVFVIRNLPLQKEVIGTLDLRSKFNLNSDDVIILYQGVILEGRGISLMIRSMKQIPKAVFLIIGEGVFKDRLMEETRIQGLDDRVIFQGAVNHDELLEYTAGADIGIALIENISKSYFYALPNKLFEYIMAGLPVVVSDLPQMKKIVEKYEVGKVVDISKGTDEVTRIFSSIINDNGLRERFKSNCAAAANELNWQREFDSVKKELFPDLF